MTAMAISQPGKKTFLFRAGLLAALTILGGCASMDKAVSDTQKLYAESEQRKLKPAANLNDYSLALQRFGQMLQIYKKGDPTIYVQTRDIRDATNLSHPLVGAEIPGEITEMVRTAINRIGPNVVYIPFYPDYLVAQAQMGAQFGVTMPNYVITGALTEFDRALSGAGRSNNLSLNFGKGRGETDAGADWKRTAILSSLGLDLNLVNFSTNQMMPQMQAANVMKVWNFSKETNASLGFYGDSFGFKLEGKYLQGRHSAIRTLVDLSVLELLGKATNTPYWRSIPGAQPDPVVVGNVRNTFNSMEQPMKIAMIQVMLQKYGQPVQINQQLDEATVQAIRHVYTTHFPQFGDRVDVLTWEGFEPLFFNVPMPWDAPPKAVAQAEAGSSAASPAQ
jgi:curli biogenesis system outer membrane secretion channel CsgG